MRLGVDAQLLVTDEFRTGLHTHLVELLRGLAGALPGGTFPTVRVNEPAALAKAQATLDGLAIPLRVRNCYKVTGRPFRLRDRWAVRLSGVGRLDAFLFTAAPHDPPAMHFPADLLPAMKVFVVPDLTVIHSGGTHTGSAKGSWHDYFDAVKAHADLVITYSEHTRGEVVEAFGLPPGRVVAIPLAASPRYAVLPRAEVEAKLAEMGLTYRGYLLTVGTLEPRKNHVTLFRAYAEYLKEPGVPRLPLVVAGPRGWLDDEIHGEPAKLGIADMVRFVGRVPEIEHLYNGAAAFVYPSLYEGFGLPPLEAMACGAPTITSDATSLPEVVGDASVLVAPTDVPGFRDAIRRVLTDPDFARELTERGVRRAAEFSWRKTAERYVAAIAAAIDAKH